MQFDVDKMAAADRYELLLGTIVPRPIALITTLGPDGRVNAAPYSLFNIMGHDPAVAMVSVLAHPEARLKDTANNILATKEFVINLVSETVAEADRLGHGIRSLWPQGSSLVRILEAALGLPEYSVPTNWRTSPSAPRRA